MPCSDYNINIIISSTTRRILEHFIPDNSGQYVLESRTESQTRRVYSSVSYDKHTSCDCAYLGWEQEHSKEGWMLAQMYLHVIDSRGRSWLTNNNNVDVN